MKRDSSSLLSFQTKIVIFHRQKTTNKSLQERKLFISHLYIYSYWTRFSITVIYSFSFKCKDKGNDLITTQEYGKGNFCITHDCPKLHPKFISIQGDQENSLLEWRWNILSTLRFSFLNTRLTLYWCLSWVKFTFLLFTGKYLWFYIKWIKTFK